MAVKKYGNNWGIFTPSISQMYVLAHAKNWPRQPIPFKPLDFLDPKNDFFYPYALYSAGHAHLDPVKSDEREPMIQGRDRSKTMMIGDSGGFQAATGVLDFDWSDPLGPKSLEQRLAIMKWLEHTSDYSMILDWPAWAIDIGRLPDSLKEKDPTTGLVTNDPFHNCLNGTVWNNNFFIKNRTPGATKFLNVFQGRSYEEAAEWFDMVAPFSDKKIHGDRAFEGYALGGSTGADPTVTMRTLIKLRDKGLLDGDDRVIHILGRARLTTAVYATALNQALCKHVNENCQVTYDAASAFLYAVNGNYVTDWSVKPDSLNLISSEFPMGEQYIGSDEPFILNGVSPERLADPTHFKSQIARTTKMGDYILPPNDQAVAKGKKYSMDTASYFYIMAHNVECQIRAIDDANRKLDMPNATDYIPSIYLEYREFINEVFQTENPMAMIEASGNRYAAIISGHRPGVSALENRTLFPMPMKPEPEVVEGEVAVDVKPKKQARPPKPVKVHPVKPAIVDSGLFGNL